MSDLWVLKDIGPEWEIERPATPADLLAVVRRGVESGTIKGEVVRWCVVHRADQATWGPTAWCYKYANDETIEESCHLVDALVIPVSDGGSKT